MQIILNGEAQKIREGMSVQHLLGALEIDPGTVAVEVNREIVKRAGIRDYVLEEGDIVEILQFVGGG